MARVQVVKPQTATGEARTLLDAVQAKLGGTPNFIRVLANSPKALEGFLGLYGALGGATLDKATRERIALVALNIFTNILGKATRIEIDFPKVDLLAAPVRHAA